MLNFFLFWPGLWRGPCWRSYDTPPALLVYWGGDDLSPLLTPLHTFGVSISGPVFKYDHLATLIIVVTTA